LPPSGFAAILGLIAGLASMCAWLHHIHTHI
jgi:hypothetical protein